MKPCAIHNDGNNTMHNVMQNRRSSKSGNMSMACWTRAYPPTT